MSPGHRTNRQNLRTCRRTSIFLRSLNFSSIKTTLFYLLRNQSSAAGSQPNATFWCIPFPETRKIPALFALFRMFPKSNIAFLPARPHFSSCGNLVTKQKSCGVCKIRCTNCCARHSAICDSNKPPCSFLQAPIYGNSTRDDTIRLLFQGGRFGTRLSLAGIVRNTSRILRGSRVVGNQRGSRSPASRIHS